jgi:Phage integrase central domain
MGLGSFPLTTLAEARDFRDRWREVLMSGLNPIEARKAGRTSVYNKTFGSCADELLTANSPQWSNGKHRQQWRTTLETYAAPLYGLPVDQVGTDAVLDVLKPLWQAIPETASRLRGRIEAVLDFAKAHGWRSGENPAAWRGHLALILPKRGKLSRGHHAAMPYRNLPEFIGTWWLTVSDVFHVYQVGLSQGASPIPAPLELLAVITKLASYIAAGQIPDSIVHASSQGRHRPGPTEARDMGIAVAYMLATRPGGLEHCGETIVIADKMPVRTICEALGIRQTAYDWQQAVQPSLSVNPVDGEMLASLMREAGARYKEAGRSRSAVIRRRTRK